MRSIPRCWESLSTPLYIFNMAESEMITNGAHPYICLHGGLRHFSFSYLDLLTCPLFAEFISSKLGLSYVSHQFRVFVIEWVFSSSLPFPELVIGRKQSHNHISWHFRRTNKCLSNYKQCSCVRQRIAKRTRMTLKVWHMGVSRDSWKANCLGKKKKH